MIGRKILLAFLMKLGTAGLGYVSLVFIARWMGPEPLGILGFGFAYVGLLNFIADFGYGTAHIKRVSEGHDLPACLGTYTLIRIVLVGLLVVATLGSVFIYKNVLGQGFESPTHEYMIYVALIAMCFYALSAVVGQTFAGRRETFKQTAPEVAGKLVEVSVKVAVALAGASVLMLGWASVAGAAVALLCFAVLVRPFRFGRPRAALVRSYTTFALPVTVIVASNALTDNLDKLMIQAFWNSELLGFYIGAARISAILWLVKVAVDALVFPTISSLHQQNRMDAVRDLTHTTERYLALLLLPVGVVLSVHATPIVRIMLGAGFAPAGPILCLLAWTTLVHVLSVPYYNQIIGTNRAGLSAGLSILLVVLNVMLNLVFIPRSFMGVRMLGLGPVGAATATLIAAVLMAVTYRLFARRYTATGFNWSLLRIAGAGAAMAWLIHVSFSLPGLSGLPGLVVTSLLGLAAYAGLLLVMREVTKEDVRLFRGVISPKGMKNYIVNELCDSDSESGKEAE